MELDNLQTFFGLFSQWRFHIPDYQRGYAWGEEQWKALLEDLSTLTEDNEHFTGLLVLHENRDPNLSVRTRGIRKPVFDIVDGQQRLTSIVILLNEIQREMMHVDGSDDLHEIAASIVDTYLYEPAAGNILVPKLILDSNNNTFFTHNILELDGKDLQGARIQSHKNLEGARRHFQAYLHSYQERLKESYPGWLERLYDKIANQMKVMVYRLRSEADAGVVFEAMNNRGKKPNNLDLVKNYLLYLASKLGTEVSQKLSADINRAWSIIFEQLNAAGRTDAEDTLLQMHWFAIYDYDQKHWNIEKEKANIIKNRFQLVNYLDRYDELFKELENYVQTLQNAVVVFADISNPSRSGAFQIFEGNPTARKDIVKYSNKLLRLGVLRPFTPLLIAVRLSFPDDAEKYLEMVKLCELYAFRLFAIAEKRNNSKDAILFRLANQLFNGKMSFNSVCGAMRRDLIAECPDSLFDRSFSTENPTPWYGKRGLAYFLFEYEEELFKPDEPIINWKTIIDGGEKSIEHILPQNPPRDGYWAERFSLEEQQHFLNQIGNLSLILASWNSSLGNKSFPDKKGVQGQINPCYANSDLKITNRLTSYKDWTPKEIVMRQQKLKEWALVRWFVETPPTLPNEPWERQLEQARRNGVEKEFLDIRDIAQRLDLNLSPSTKCVIYKPKSNWRLNVLTVYTYQNVLGIRFRPHNLSLPKKFPKDKIKEIFGEQRDWYWVNPEQFIELRTRFERLISEIIGAK